VSIASALAVGGIAMTALPAGVVAATVDRHGTIPFDRLQLAPQALRCAPCQTTNDIF
jgi:hypothetical protein